MTSRRLRRASVALCRRLGVVVVGLGALGVNGRAEGQTATSARAGSRYPKVDLAVGYRVDPSWPAKPLPYVWGAMPGVAVDAQDRVWTFNRGKMPVQAFSPDGKLVEAWGEGLFKTPHGIRIGRDGNVWVTDVGLHVVQEFTPKGALLLTIGTAGKPGEDDRHLNQPTDVAVTPRGDVFISDGYGNNRVVHFDARGRFVKAWGKLGAKPGEFSLPHAVAVDSRGRLYVCDRNNARVQVFDPDGRFLSEWRNLMVPWGIWISAKDEVLLCGSSPMRWGEDKYLGLPPKDQLVMKLDTEGRVHELWTFPSGEPGKEKPGELDWLHGIGVDSHGGLYLGDIKGCRAQKFVRLGS